MDVCRYARTEFITRLFNTNPNLCPIDDSVICNAENLPFFHQSKHWPLGISPTLCSHSSERRKNTQRSMQRLFVCVTWSKTKLHQLINIQTFIKNQYSSTLSTAAAFINLPEENKGFCVYACVYGCVTLWGVYTSVNQNIDQIQQTLDTRWIVQVHDEVTNRGTIQEKEPGDMSKSKLKRSSYFRHVSHARHKDRDGSCITSVCVTGLWETKTSPPTLWQRRRYWLGVTDVSEK